MESAEIKDKSIYVKLKEHGTVYYCFFWYRENCRCKDCYNHITFQVKNFILNIPEDVYPAEVSVKDDVLHVLWDDNHHSEYTASFLWECWPENWRRVSDYRRLWAGNDVANHVAVVDRNDFLTSNETMKKFLHSVAAYGFAFIDNVFPTIEDTELVVKRVGPIQRTIYGEMWSLTSGYHRADNSYSSIELESHNDNTFLNEAGGLQFIHLLEHDGTGGESFVVDGFYVADWFKKNDLQTYKTLTTQLLTAHFLETGLHHILADHVIKLNPVNQEVRQIKFANQDRSPYCISAGEDQVQMYAALRKFAKVLEDPENQYRFQLKPGRLLCIDNWRLLHGRKHFTGKRVLAGAYVMTGDWQSAARIQGIIP